MTVYIAVIEDRESGIGLAAFRKKEDAETFVRENPIKGGYVEEVVVA